MAIRLRSAAAVRTMRQPRVFLVEDDDDSRGLIAAWLQQSCRQVIESATPHLDFGDDLQPQDVFLIDLSLQDGDGLVLIERLAERRFEGAIVLMSAFPEKVIHTVKEIALQRGLCGPSVLKKPFTHEQLLRSMHLAAAGDRSRIKNPRVGPTDLLADLLDERRLLFHYQPIVCAWTGALHGVESLARGRRADGQIISAAPAIEVGGVEDLRRLTRKAVADAIHLWRLLASGGVRCRVSVNMPSSQLNFAEFEGLLPGGRDEREVRDALTFEITETESFARKSETRVLVTQKVLQGYHFSLDDFGVGASNLDRLADLPFQELKIDRRFVDGCADARFKRAVCRNAVEIARETQAKVVVEGVERQADLECLREMGVDRVQGYLVAKPMNRAALTNWLSEYDASRLISK